MRKIPGIASVFLALALIMSLAGCASSPVAMEYSGSRLGEGMYSFFLSTFKYSFVKFYYGGTEPDWSAEYSPGITLEDYARGLIDEKIEDILISVKLFRDMGLGIDRSVSEEIDADIAEKADYAGGTDELDKELSKFGIDSEKLRECYIALEKQNAVESLLFGTGGELAVSPEEIADYYEGNYSLVKFAVIYYKEKIETDSDGNSVYGKDGRPSTVPLSEDEIAEKLALAEEAYESALNDEDMKSTVEKYSEADSGVFDDGYFVSSNETSVFGEPFVSAAAEMNPGQVRKVVDEDAVFIIRKYALPEYSSLAGDSLSQLGGIGGYVKEIKKEAFYAERRAGVTLNAVVTDKYSVAKAPLNGKY